MKENYFFSPPINLTTHDLGRMKDLLFEMDHQLMEEDERKSLPLLLWVVAFFTLLAMLGDIKILGFSLTGWGWVVPLMFSLFIIPARIGQIALPVKIWFPWITLTLIYLILSEYPSLQRTAQLLTPIFVGMAISSYSIGEIQIERFLSLCKRLGIAIFVLIIIRAGVLLSGRLPGALGLAPHVMTVALLCTVFAAMHASGRKRALLWWLLLASIPVIGITRTGIVVAGLTLPLTFVPMKLRKRLMLLAVICVLGLLVFYSPRIQKKMFYTGRGEIADLLTENLKTHGRRYMSEVFTIRIKEKPILGHGAGSGQVLALNLSRGLLRYPHNDWLLQLYDYGILGTTVFFFTIVFASWHAYASARLQSSMTRIMLLAGSASFVPLALFMVTDNIIVYASFFGNLQFSLLGIAYAAAKNRGVSTAAVQV